MLREEQIAALCLDRGLVTVGWIHTHPQQGLFMSSMDTHTHCSYQLLLEEAISVILAPRDPVQQVGVFRLTDAGSGGGLRFIAGCELRGFHPHPSGLRLYEQCGHVTFDSAAPELQIVDLRSATS